MTAEVGGAAAHEAALPLEVERVAPAAVCRGEGGEVGEWVGLDGTVWDGMGDLNPWRQHDAPSLQVGGSAVGGQQQQQRGSSSSSGGVQISETGATLVQFSTVTALDDDLACTHERPRCAHATPRT